MPEPDDHKFYVGASGCPLSCRGAAARVRPTVSNPQTQNAKE